MNGMTAYRSPAHCPDCGRVLHHSPGSCPGCGFPLLGETAAALWQVELQIAELDRRRAALVERHAQLRYALREQGRRAAPSPPSPAASGAGRAPGTAPPPAVPGPRPAPRSLELSARSVRNLLLILGGLLLATAAVVFTVVTWSDLPIGARGAILAGVTLLVGYLPRPLQRRSMPATAETFGLLAAVLLCLDLFALGAVLEVAGTDAAGYAAVSAGAAALLLAGYAHLLPLTAPKAAALLLAQSVPLAAALASDSPLLAIGVALPVTALGNLLLLRFALRRSLLRRIAAVLGTAAWALGALSATGWAAFAALDRGTGLEAAGQFTAAGMIALLAARYRFSERMRGAALTGLTGCWIALPPVAVAAAPEWMVPAAATAAAGAAVLPLLLDTEWRRGPLWTVALVLGTGGLVGSAAFAPLAEWLPQVAAPWEGAEGLPSADPALLTYAVAAVASAAGWGVLSRRLRPEATLSLVLGTALLLVLLAAQSLPHAAGVAMVAAAAVCLLGGAAAAERAGRNGSTTTALALALPAGLLAVVGALATAVSTMLVLGVFAVAAAVCAVLPGTGPRVRAAAIAAAATTAGAVPPTGYAVLVHTGLPLEPRWQAFAGLAMAGGAAAAGRLPLFAGRPEQRGALAGAGMALVLFSAVIGAGFPETWPLLAATTGLVAAGLAGVLPATARWMLALPAGGAAALAAVLVLPAWATAVFAPWSWITAVWQGEGTPMRPAPETLLPDAVPPDLPASTLAAVALGAAAVLLLVRMHRPELLRFASAVLAVPVLLPFPVLLGLPTWFALVWPAAVAAALLAAAARSDSAAARAAGGAALWPLLTLVVWGLAEPFLTLAALAATVLLAAAYPVFGRAVPVTAGATAVAVLATGGFTVALLAALDRPVEVAALGPTLVVAGVTAALAAARLPAQVRPAAAGSAVVLAVAAIGLTLAAPERLELTSVVLAALGVTAAAGAVRAGRRLLGMAGAGLLLAALWVFLGWLRVAAPEPYLLLPALGALAVGWEWRRRAARAPAGTASPPGSWSAFGAGLALALLPSLVMIYVAPDPLRLTALGAAGLVCTLLGARYRLQAPLLIGGLVLVLAAQSASGTPLWELVVSLPTWLPVGAVGLLLVAAGARFERNLQGLRRLGRALRAME